MKKVLVFMFFFMLAINIYAEDDCTYLARVVSNEMRGEPYIVKVAFCEMLLNCLESEYYPDTLAALAHVKGVKRCKGSPTESDIYAASSAFSGIRFFGKIQNVKPWREVKNTPLEKSGGVRLYKWYFY